MSNKEIVELKVNNCIIKDEYLNYYNKQFQTPMEEGVELKTKSSWYEIVKDNEIIENDVILLLVEHGSIKKPSSKLKDINSKKTVDNPRKESQVEPHFKFVFIDLRQSKIYHSNVSLQLISKYLRLKLKIPTTKFNYKTDIDRNKFLNGLKTVKSANFVISDRNIFELDDDFYKTLTNNMYDDGLADLSVEMNFKDNQNKGNILNKLKPLLNKIDENSEKDGKSIKLIGRDESNLEQIYNFDNLQYKITLLIEQKELYDEGDCKIILNDFKNKLNM